MSNLGINLADKGLIKIESGTKVIDVLSQTDIRKDLPLLLGKLNENYLELEDTIEEEGTLEPIYISDTFGRKAYVRTLQFILIKAVCDLFPDAVITIEHSLSKGIFGEIHKQPELDCEDILKIKKKMQEIIDKDIPIYKSSVTKDKAISVFKSYGMEDKIRLIKHVKQNSLKLYELDGRYDYFYGLMAASTGVGKVFDIIYNDPGFLLQFPSEKDSSVVEPFQENEKLARIFYETEKWGDILDVPDVGALNDKVDSEDIINIIRVSEALHEKKIANIADMIGDRKEVRLVLIAGPSSSGKTTFSNRLGIQLRVNGVTPIPISLDDYFLDREKTPKDENGEYDFESIYALDLELFNKQLNELLEGKEVELPTFDFRLGTRVWEGRKLSLPENGILIVEGIHGLNDILTSTIPAENKFKIYISALTQLNLDNHNRISTTDVRIIRRIVRDFLSRGYGGETTLKMRESIKRGEEKNIFVFQEEADVMFNSTLVYELCVLKKYAMEELSKIQKNSPVYYDAVKLKSFLSFFKEVDKELVPENSILREFIGGSCFYKY